MNKNKLLLVLFIWNINIFYCENIAINNNKNILNNPNFFDDKQPIKKEEDIKNLNPLSKTSNKKKNKKKNNKTKKIQLFFNKYFQKKRKKKIEQKNSNKILSPSKNEKNLNKNNNNNNNFYYIIFLLIFYLIIDLFIKKNKTFYGTDGLFIKTIDDSNIQQLNLLNKIIINSNDFIGAKDVETKIIKFIEEKQKLYNDNDFNKLIEETVNIKNHSINLLLPNDNFFTSEKDLIENLININKITLNSMATDSSLIYSSTFLNNLKKNKINKKYKIQANEYKKNNFVSILLSKKNVYLNFYKDKILIAYFINSICLMEISLGNIIEIECKFNEFKHMEIYNENILFNFKYNIKDNYFFFNKTENKTEIIKKDLGDKIKIVLNPIINLFYPNE